MAARNVYFPLIISFFVINTLAVALRLYTRVWTKSLGRDDALIGVSLIGFFIFGAFELQAIHYGIGATTLEASFDMTKAAKFFTIAQLVYIVASGIAKIAVALVLLRLTNRSDMRLARIILWALIVIIVVFTAVVTLVFALQCRPLSLAWGVGTGTCISTSIIGDAGLALSIEDVITSWMSAAFPVYLLWKVAIPLKVKLTVYVILGFGAVGSVATIICLKYVIIVRNLAGDAGLAAAQIVETTVEATIYSILEIALSIFAAALVALRPLMRKIGFFSDGSTAGQSGSKSGGSYAMHTFGQGSRNANGAIKLDDVDNDSQQGIVVATRMQSEK